MVTASGLIACLCADCVGKGAQYSSSEWEAHAGSKERRPAEAIHLTDHGMTLRVRSRCCATSSATSYCHLRGWRREHLCPQQRAICARNREQLVCREHPAGQQLSGTHCFPSDCRGDSRLR